MIRLTALLFVFLSLPVTPVLAAQTALSEAVSETSSSTTTTEGAVRDRNSSLLSEWLGSNVLVNDSQGNWAEALTGYLSDHAVAEREGRGAEFRKQLLLDYAATVNSRNELSLREIREGNKNPAARAIGYDKGVMVFHMLNQTIGANAFEQGLRAFLKTNGGRTATWDDIRIAMEKASGKNLGPFFEQWVTRKGLPELSAGHASVKRNVDAFEVQVSGILFGENYEFDAPATLETAGGSKKNELLSLGGDKQVSLLVDEEPRTLVIDPGYDIARLPSTRETPPLIKATLAAEQPLIVKPVSRVEAYSEVAAYFKKHDATENAASEITYEKVKSSPSIVVLGNDNPVLGKLFGSVETVQAGFSITAHKNPWNEEGDILVMNAESGHEVQAALPQLETAGAFSAAAYSNGSRIFARTGDSSKGVEMALREEPTAIDLSLLKTFSEALRAAEEKRIIYVGEYHDKYEHHLIQFQVIKKLFKKGEKLAIGMEMFQRPFQPALDDYIQGRIDERSFLKKSEYFKRWGFDYNLYKPILDFARQNSIPVVALNQRKEITDKVAKTGLDSLTAEERTSVPLQMDFSDNEYRDRLQAVFRQHQGAPDRDFESFYQAQVLWDETMAMSIDEFLKKNPDHRMIVIAGSGHLAYGSGIPKRCFRRNNLPYFLALNDGELDRKIADYLILSQPLQGTEAPKLMVILSIQNKRVIVNDFPEDSVSKRAGVRAGDVIRALDGEPVQSVDDLRLALFFKKKGDIVKVTVLRKSFWAGEKTMEIDVKL